MADLIRLEASEARVLGVLIEKELTTPDGYPLSLNALQAGCNQKSNRNPVVDMSEGLVFSAAERLRMLQLAGAVHPAGSRVEKFRHNARETLAASDAELALLAELCLRGAQTHGELRTRASRMAPIETSAQLEAFLSGLAARGLVTELPPEPGSRARRVATTLVAGSTTETSETRSPRTGESDPRSQAGESSQASLEERVARLEERLADLVARLGDL